MYRHVSQHDLPLSVQETIRQNNRRFSQHVTFQKIHRGERELRVNLYPKRKVGKEINNNNNQLNDNNNCFTLRDQNENFNPVPCPLRALAQNNVIRCTSEESDIRSADEENNNNEHKELESYFGDDDSDYSEVHNIDNCTQTNLMVKVCSPRKLFTEKSTQIDLTVKEEDISMDNYCFFDKPKEIVNKIEPVDKCMQTDLTFNPNIEVLPQNQSLERHIQRPKIKLKRINHQKRSFQKVDPDPENINRAITVEGIFARLNSKNVSNEIFNDLHGHGHRKERTRFKIPNTCPKCWRKKSQGHSFVCPLYPEHNMLTILSATPLIFVSLLIIFCTMSLIMRLYIIPHFYTISRNIYELFYSRPTTVNNHILNYLPVVLTDFLESIMSLKRYIYEINFSFG